MAQKKLFLLDALALIYRAHFAFSKNPRITSTGINTGAIYGFMNTLLEVINNEKPTHLGVAYDTPQPTFRHVQFVEYKAQRQAQPEDITVAVPYTKRILEALGIPVLLKDGYEADDIIGTLAQQAEKEGFEVFMMTPDKDYSQLVTENIKLYKPAFAGKEVSVWGVQEVLDKWQIKRVEQVIDILGLQGDAVDNIPGVPGIGEKTAIKLLQDFDSIENLIANADKITGKNGEKIKQYAKQALLCKQLATIETAVPIAFESEKLLLQPFNKDEVLPIFKELEFRTLAQRMFGTDIFTANLPQQKEKKTDTTPVDLFSTNSATEKIEIQENTPKEKIVTKTLRNIQSVNHQYFLADTKELQQNLVEILQKSEAFCFDTETDGLDAHDTGLVGLAFAIKPNEAWYVPIPTHETEVNAILTLFKPILENENIKKIGQNLKFDMLVLAQYGIHVKGELFDTMVAHYLTHPDQRHNMDFMATTLLGYQPISIESLIGAKGKNQRSMRTVPIAQVKEYAAEDADVTFQLYQKLQQEIEQQGLQKLMYEVEAPLVRTLTQMEINGIAIDTQALSEMSAQYEEELRSLEQHIFDMAKEPFNINSPQQLGKILFDKLKIDTKVKKTKTGQYATGEDILEKYADEHQIVQLVLEYRELQKLKSTYIDALPQLLSRKDNRLHTSFNQTVTATGRLSSTNPNLQNIPVRTERGKEIRRAFIPANDDFLLMAADYSQIELRIMASFSGDESMLAAFQQGKDIHAATAAKVFRTNEVTAEMRRQAKTVNFGIIYGISAFGLASRMGIKRTAAKEIIEAYFAEFPAVKQYMDKSIEQAREKGYVETILGRKRYLPEIYSQNATMRGFAERNAINSPIQGSAADMIKIAMVRVQDWLTKEKLQSKMLLQVHDELVFDAHKSEIELLKKNIPLLMADALPLNVPIVAEVGIGKNWLEAH